MYMYKFICMYMRVCMLVVIHLCMYIYVHICMSLSRSHPAFVSYLYPLIETLSVWKVLDILYHKVLYYTVLYYTIL